MVVVTPSLSAEFEAILAGRNNRLYPHLIVRNIHLITGM